MALIRLPNPTALAVVLLFQLTAFAASDANAFRIIASSSGAAGIAQAPCCDTGYDGGFESSTLPFVVGMPGVLNVMEAGGSKAFPIPRTDPIGRFGSLDYGSEARASMIDIGARAWVEINDWDIDFTGGSIEAFASARLEQVFSADSASDLWLRPVFQIEGSMSFVDGFVSSMSFVMRPPGGGDVELLRIDTGTPGTPIDVVEQLVGPEIAISAGGDVFLALILSTQVTGTVNNIGEGNHFVEVDAFNTLSLLGFEAYADPGLTTPVNVQITSDSGQVFNSIPEPGTASLLGLGLALMAAASRRSA